MALTPPGDGPITLINVFDVPVETVDEFIERWRVRAQLMTAAPGFRDARLHRAVTPDARFPLVNVAHWDSQADLEAAHAADAFQEQIRALRDDARMAFSAYAASYELAVVLNRA
ncbi:antibiotic biosynthesis monooxygenase family protein [Rugosimonospora africana]|uniref:ABM domain-containing protein n=1 Tax=Rugosimonospora africana TaxID=556532 RepID=A0A8J3QRK5_9ACTN|nr:antibiotic biosynthesis monooxygenase family protein [Rugosimonospora africana]GIH14243.1 hypothetical protein Raf01_24150 [Rugosimonospora africana]